MKFRKNIPELAPTKKKKPKKKRKLKIAIFTDTFLPQHNGVVQSILNNIEYFYKRGHKVWVFAPGKRYKIETRREFKLFRSFSMPFIGHSEYRLAAISVDKFKEVFKREKFDVIHCHTQFYMGINGLILSREYKIPAISTYHTLFESYEHYLDPFPLPKSLSDLRTGSLYYYLRKFHKSFYKTIVPTKTLSTYLKNKRKINTTVLTNSIRFDKQKHVNIKRKYKIPRSSKLILFVGRIGKEKNLDLLLDAYKSIQAKKVYLLIAGYGPYLPHLQTRIKSEQIKNVIFTGKFPSNIKKSLYSACTFFVSASESETQGMTFIEAMLRKKPVIGVRAQGAIDVIKDNANGYLVKPGDSTALAEKMKQLLDHPRLIKKFGKASKKLAKEYSIDKVGEQMIKLYRRAIANHKIDPGTRSTFLRFLITKDPQTLKQAFKKLQERLGTTIRII